jgi:hypothetical protein
MAPVQRTNSWRGPDRQALNSSTSTDLDNYRGDRRTRCPHHSRRSLGRPVASNFNNHLFSSKLLICFGFRCAVNPMTFWLRRSTKRRISSVRLWQKPSSHRSASNAPHPGPGSWHKYQDYLYNSSGPLVQSYKWTTTNWPFNDMVREAQRILMDTERESRRLKLI